MRRRRALTLVEVLAATVLLAILTGTCVPFIERAARDLAEPHGVVPIDELGALADAVVADPEAFGIEDIRTVDRFELAWPEAPGRPAVGITMLTQETPAGGERTEEPTHAWLTFTSGEAIVFRWIEIGAVATEEAAP
jgi:hypothetical protein